MKVHAHHSADGAIQALVIFDGPPDMRLALAARPGQAVTEVIGLNIDNGIPDAKQLKKLTAGVRIPPAKFQWTGRQLGKRKKNKKR